MKYLSSVVVVFLAVSFFFVGSLFAQDEVARIQIIHNAADPGANQVDVYVNDGLALDDFEFRTATPFIDLPAGVQLTIGVAPPNSSSSADALATFDVTLEAGGTYVAIANGVLDPTDFSANPDGEDTAFNLFVKQMARETASSQGNVDFFVFHGVTDAPAVDILTRDQTALVSGAAYGDMTDYLSIPADNYSLDVTAAGNPDAVVASVRANLRQAADWGAVVFASGFLDPEANQNGQAFGVFAALPDGYVFQFRPLTVGFVQLIHNSADPAAASVDVYLGDTQIADDFAFRSATGFLQVPVNTPLNIGVAPGNSTSSADVIATFELSVLGEERYVGIANGVLDPTGFADNPQGFDIAFQPYIKADVREDANWKKYFEFFAFHGVTDAPAVDIRANGAPAITDLGYGQFTDYLRLWPEDPYVLDIVPSGTNTVLVSYELDVAALEGETAVVFASGFLTPADNQDGMPFGLFAALKDGQVVELPTTLSTGNNARIQIIHNSPDPGVETVDIYLNETKAVDDFTFRTATPFIDFPGNKPVAVGFAPATSASADDILITVDVTLEGGETYVAIATGVLDPSGYAANPGGLDIAFAPVVKMGVRESALWKKYFEFFAFHGATDAPSVDIWANGNMVISDLAYQQSSDYLRIWPEGNYKLDITPAGDNTVVASFDLAADGLAGLSAVVFASGFLSPADNQDGPAFGLYAALPTGDVVAIPAYEEGTSAQQRFAHSAQPNALDQDVETVKEFSLKPNFPNPFNPTTTITFSLPESEFVTLEIYDIMGRRVGELVNSKMSAGIHQINFDARNLPSGKYFYRLRAGSFEQINQMLLLK